MAKVLILGASGLLGTTLVPSLKTELNDEIVSHGLTQSAHLNGDLTDITYLNSLIEQQSPSVIVNLVAFTNVDACEEDPQKSYLINAKIVENLVQVLKHSPQTLLIQISTDQLYDSPGNNTENQIVLKNYYAQAKYQAEVSATNANAVILRTNFFGKSERPSRTSFSDWIYESISSKKEITLFDDVFFSPLSIKTLCSMIAKVIKSPVPGVYNLGSREGMSKAEFALYLESRLNIGKLNYKIGHVDLMNLKAKRPKGMMMDVSKFESTYKVSLPTLKTEIDSLIKDYL